MRDGGLLPGADERWLTPRARQAVRGRARLLRDRATGSTLDLDDVDGTAALSARAAAGERYDTVVSVLRLWAWPDLAGALADVRLLVAPGGRLLFFEPNLGSGTTARVQRLLAPSTRAVTNRHPARDVPAALRAAGFRVTDCERVQLPMPWPWRMFVEGSAR